MDDLISRQEAIDALIRKIRPHNNGDGTITMCVMSEELVRETLNDLPAAQSAKRTEERAKTHACDCISRQAAIRWVKTECNPYGKPTLDFESGKKVIEHLERMPSAQPERLTGRWVSVGCVVPSIANVPMIKCTVCGHSEPDMDAARTPYCPHCGAYMKGGEDD